MANIAKQDNNLILYKANLKDKQTAASPLPLSLVGKEGKGERTQLSIFKFQNWHWFILPPYICSHNLSTSY